LDEYEHPAVSSRVDHTPDYEDPRLRAALTNFIHALGRRYDGDPRLGFLGLGLLGTWGEWHNHPHTEWFASKTVQREVMDAYEAAFRNDETRRPLSGRPERLALCRQQHPGDRLPRRLLRLGHRSHRPAKRRLVL
jgi:hypothetical protein